MRKTAAVAGVWGCSLAAITPEGGLFGSRVCVSCVCGLSASRLRGIESSRQASAFVMRAYLVAQDSVGCDGLLEAIQTHQCDVVLEPADAVPEAADIPFDLSEW